MITPFVTIYTGSRVNHLYLYNVYTVYIYIYPFTVQYIHLYPLYHTFKSIYPCISIYCGFCRCFHPTFSPCCQPLPPTVPTLDVHPTELVGKRWRPAMTWPSGSDEQGYGIDGPNRNRWFTVLKNGDFPWLC